MGRVRWPGVTKLPISVMKNIGFCAFFAKIFHYG